VPVSPAQRILYQEPTAVHLTLQIERSPLAIGLDPSLQRSMRDVAAVQRSCQLTCANRYIKQVGNQPESLPAIGAPGVALSPPPYARELGP
jgi:hypothetical protein